MTNIKEELQTPGEEQKEKLHVIKKFCLSQLCLEMAEAGKWLIEICEDNKKLKMTDKERLKKKEKADNIRALFLELIEY